MQWEFEVEINETTYIGAKKTSRAIDKNYYTDEPSGVSLRIPGQWPLGKHLRVVVSEIAGEESELDTEAFQSDQVKQTRREFS